MGKKSFVIVELTVTFSSHQLMPLLLILYIFLRRFRSLSGNTVGYLVTPSHRLFCMPNPLPPSTPPPRPFLPTCSVLPLKTQMGGGVEHRVHILVEMKQGQCICPLSWSVHCNFTGEAKCYERGWACTPHPHQLGLILPSSLNVRPKAAVSTLCTLGVE